MSARFLALSAADQRLAFENAALGLRLSPVVLEKDFWVSWLLGLVAVMAYLLRKIGPSSSWLDEVADVIDIKPDLPGCGWHALGIGTNDGFPRNIFR